MHTEVLVGSKHQRADVQSVVFPFRNPGAVEIYQHFEGLHEKIFRNLRHTHALRGEIKATRVHFRTEEHRFSMAFGGFHSLKNTLSVMERKIGGRKIEPSERLDARIDPLCSIVINDEHVVGNNLPERDVGEVNRW